MEQTTDNRISYIKKRMASHSFPCLGMAVVGLVLCAAGLTVSVRTQGNVPLGGAAVCFSSFLFSVGAVWYGFASFREKDRNYILARIGMSAGGLLTILWFVVLLIGFKR